MIVFCYTYTCRSVKRSKDASLKGCQIISTRQFLPSDAFLTECKKQEKSRYEFWHSVRIALSKGMYLSVEKSTSTALHSVRLTLTKEMHPFNKSN